MSGAQTDPEFHTRLRGQSEIYHSETTGFSFRTQLRREQAMTSNLQTFLLNQDRNIAEEMDTTAEEFRKRVREAEERETKKRASVRDLVVKNLGSDPGPIPFAATAASSSAAAASSSSAAAPPRRPEPASSSSAAAPPRRTKVRSRSPANKTTDKQDAKGNTKTETAAPPKMSPEPSPPPKTTPPKTTPTKGVKKDMKTKSNQAKKTEFGTQVDKSNDINYWKSKNKGYIVDQLALRGYRGDAKKTAKMTKEKLAELIVTFPVK
jgi:hypothetical protein